MLVKRIHNATRVLGAPNNWDEEKDGICVGLPIRDEADAGVGNCMWSAWEPTAEEIDRLRAGAPVLLCVAGRVHPPVALMVGYLSDPPAMPSEDQP